LRTKLNDFAKSFADAINNTYKDNLEDASTYSPLVTYESADPAKTISITSAWRGVPETFVKGVKNDETSISNYLTDLYNQIFSQNGTTVDITSLSGGASTKFSGTISSFADSFTTEISSAISVLGGKSDSFKTTSSNLDDQRQSISSVSVNDEGVNLIKYQQAYNASARVITAIDQMLDKLINGTGSVGL
jgi:flagellar hook-associated protein 1 FlgK